MKSSLIFPIASLGVGIALALTSTLGSIGFAQSANDLDGEFQSNEANSTYGSDLGTGFNPMDLIHRMQLNNGMSQEEFYNESQQKIDNAADDFKRQQNERMLEQSNTNTEATTTEGNGSSN